MIKVLFCVFPMCQLSVLIIFTYSFLYIVYFYLKIKKREFFGDLWSLLFVLLLVFLQAFIHGSLFPCVYDDYLEAIHLNLWKTYKTKVMVLSSSGDLILFPFESCFCYRLGLFYYHSKSISGGSFSVPPLC